MFLYPEAPWVLQICQKQILAIQIRTNLIYNTYITRTCKKYVEYKVPQENILPNLKKNIKKNYHFIKHIGLKLRTVFPFP